MTYSPVRLSRRRFSPRRRQIVCRNDVETALGHYALALFDIGALEPHDQRLVEPKAAGRADNALGDDVTAHDAAEDVDKDALHILVGENDLEGFGDTLGGGATTDIEEVRRRAALQLDDVHGRHG